MSRALIFGGSGAIGRALATRLLDEGWDVDLTGRNPLLFDRELRQRGATYIESDRRDVTGLHAVFGAGADLLVDCVCYTRADAAQLIPLAANATSTVMISSKAVYVDAAGRHANSPGGPVFGGPIRESQATMRPSNEEYNSADGYGANKVAAELALLDSGLPISILRPSKIHGVGSRLPREWFFVRRILDRRPLLLADEGRGVESLTSSVNVAALIHVIAEKPATRVLNAADPDRPDVNEMASIIAAHLDYEWPRVELLPGNLHGLGRTPWGKGAPVMLDVSAALELGYRPAGDYSSTVADEVHWLEDLAVDEEGLRLPDGYDNAYFDGLFDYASEDAYLREHPTH